jgi:hypothetical protein
VDPHLGKPDIELSNLRLWVHGRAFPKEPASSFDALQLDVTAHCGEVGADVWVRNILFRVDELDRWYQATKRMYQTVSGEAKLAPWEPYLAVDLQMDSTGHFTIEVRITSDHMNQWHTFRSELDQTFLPPFLNQCEMVLARFPLPRRRWWQWK